MRRTIVLVVLAACAGPPSSEPVAFDPCTTITVGAPLATAAQVASIDDAISMWRSDGVTGLVRGDSAQITIDFRDAADAIYGYYDASAAMLYVNTRVADPLQRSIVIAHELGHAIGLLHISAQTRISVMNPGNLTTAPTDSDATSLQALWGTCAP